MYTNNESEWGTTLHCEAISFFWRKKRCRRTVDHVNIIQLMHFCLKINHKCVQIYKHLNTRAHNGCCCCCSNISSGRYFQWNGIQLRIIERHIAHSVSQSVNEKERRSVCMRGRGRWRWRKKAGRSGSELEKKTTKFRQQSCRVAAHIEFKNVYAVLRNCVICVCCLAEWQTVN